MPESIVAGARIRRAKIYAILAVLVLIGALFRWQNISQYKFYPDSYQPLIVAENIKSYGSTVGPLGESGMLYPDFFQWTRPMFPLAILAIHSFGPNFIVSAYVVDFVASLLAIVLAYLLLHKIFDSDWAGLFAAMLVSLSFSHIVWSGFIFTESLGVALVLAAFYTLFKYLAPQVSSLWGFVAGCLIAGAVLTRYEYAVIIFPVIYLIAVGPHSWSRLLYAGAGFALTASIVFYALAPWPFTFDELGSGIFPFGKVFLGIAAITSLVLIFRFRPTWHKKILVFFNTAVIIVFTVVLLLVFASKLFGFNLGLSLASLNDFAAHDFLLVSSFIVGLFGLRKGGRDDLSFFVASSILPLAYLYWTINPEIERYWLNLLPFLLIPTGALVLFVVRLLTERRAATIKLIVAVLAVFLAGRQAYLSFHGIKNWDNGIWFQAGYEELAAKQVSLLVPKQKLMLVSFPEPYFLFTQNPVVSLTNTKPFVYFDDSSDSQEIFIIEDLGMRNLFPKFSKLLESPQMQQKKISEFRVETEYRYTDQILPESSPVSIYKVSLGELKTRINESKQ